MTCMPNVMQYLLLDRQPSSKHRSECQAQRSEVQPGGNGAQACRAAVGLPSGAAAPCECSPNVQGFVSQTKHTGFRSYDCMGSVAQPPLPNAGPTSRTSQGLRTRHHHQLWKCTSASNAPAVGVLLMVRQRPEPLHLPRSHDQACLWCRPHHDSRGLRQSQKTASGLQDQQLQ